MDAETQFRPRAGRVLRDAIIALGLMVGLAMAAFGLYATVLDQRAEPGLPPVIPFGIDGLIIALLMGLVAFDLRRPRRSAKAGSALQRQFAAVFAAAAFVPALIVGIVLTFALNRGIDAWFSDRLNRIVETSTSAANAFVAQERAAIEGEMRAMQSDLLNAGAVDPASGQFQDYLREQAIFRGFGAVHLYAADGSWIIGVASNSANATPPIAPADLQSGIVALRSLADRDQLQAFARFGPNERILAVTRNYAPGFLRTLDDAQMALESWRGVSEANNRAQISYLIGYAEIMAIVLIGAIWLGLRIGKETSQPIVGLARAARKVAQGDFSVKVQPSPRVNEVSTLQSAFNRMTSQLDAQRADLLTERANAEARSRFIETVLGGVSAGVVALDATGAIQTINAPAAALLGRSGEALLGRRLAEIAPEFAEFLTQHAPEAFVSTSQIVLKRELASRVLDVRARFNEQGHVEVLTFDDMTRLVEAQRAAAWRDVARRIAHEVKNPLTPIRLAAERLARKFKSQITRDQEVFDSSTRTIVRHVDGIHRLIDHFASFATMPTPVFGLVDLRTLIQEQIEAREVAEPKVSFALTGPEAPVELRADPHLLGQAFANLLKNAAEAIRNPTRAPEGGDAAEADLLGTVLVSIASEQEKIIVDVIDSGVGFPSTDRERLFEPYVTSREQGVGLGLAIVKRIIEDHGGAILLLDRGEGARGGRVRVELPTPSSISPESAQAA